MMLTRSDNKLSDAFFKKPYLIQVLAFTFGGIYVHFDHTVPGVSVPAGYENADFYIDVCQHNVEFDDEFGMKIAILAKNGHGNADAVICEVPWDAIYMLKYGDEYLVIWIEDMPQFVRMLLSEHGMIDLPQEPDCDDPFILLSKEVEFAVRCAKATLASAKDHDLDSELQLACAPKQRQKVAFSVIPGDSNVGKSREKPDLRLLPTIEDNVGVTEPETEDIGEGPHE